MTKPLYEDGDWRKPVKARRTDLSELQVQFVEWLTDADAQLRKETQQSFADKIGVVSSTLSKWRKDPLVVKAWEARLAELNVNPERIQKLVDVLFNQGADGNVKAIELYMKLVDRMTPEKHILTTGKAAHDMSDAELAQVMRERALALEA